MTHPAPLEQPGFRIVPGDARRPQVAALLAWLDQYLTGLYPDETDAWLPPEALCAPEVTFLVGEADGAPAGCAAFVNARSHADVKRVYVAPRWRGRGYARALLAALEARARAAGLRLARLETGVLQPEAIALFESVGYVRRGVYGDYLDQPVSVFMEKRLTER